MSDPVISSRRGREIYTYITENPDASLYRICKDTKCAKATARRYKKLHAEHNDTTKPAPRERPADTSPAPANDPSGGYDFDKTFPKAPSKPPAQPTPKPDPEPTPDPANDTGDVSPKRRPKHAVRRW